MDWNMDLKNIDQTKEDSPSCTEILDIPENIEETDTFRCYHKMKLMIRFSLEIKLMIGNATEASWTTKHMGQDR